MNISRTNPEVIQDLPSEERTSKDSMKDEEPTSPTKRRKKSVVDVLKKTFSLNDEDTVIEDPTVEDLRKWLVKNPTRQVSVTVTIGFKNMKISVIL